MSSNIARTPQITEDTKILSFDLETNGLHGKAFAVGAVVMDARGRVHDKFTARCRLTSKVDDWVKANVLPVITEMPITHDNYEQMREAFWEWYVIAKDEADYVLVNNGYPVEHRFLLDCQDANIDERYWQHPFPILELSSLLLMTHGISGAGKSNLKKNMDKDYIKKMHDPLEDSIMAIKLAFEAFRSSGKI